MVALTLRKKKTLWRLTNEALTDISAEQTSNMECVLMNYGENYCTTLWSWPFWLSFYCSNNSQDPKQTQMFSTWAKRGVFLRNEVWFSMLKLKRNDLTYFIFTRGHIQLRERHTQVWEKKIPLHCTCSSHFPLITDLIKS